MAAPTETYIDPADGAAAGTDHGGNAFIDGVFNSGAPNQLTKIGAFTAATCQAGDKIYLDDNGSGEVTAGLYAVSTRDDNDNVTLTADIRSGGPEPTDVRCDNHTGVVGLPWATVQHALDFVTRDAANGDRFNVKAGTDDVLAGALDFTAYGVPTIHIPWICQGYTNAAGDGGIGGISGGAAVAVHSAGVVASKFRDMHLHNCGAALVLLLGQDCAVVNCEVDGTTGGGITFGGSSTALGNYVHNTGGIGIFQGDLVAFNHLENGAADFVHAINTSTASAVIAYNTISVDGASNGIRLYTGFNPVAMFNSIYSSSGTGQGITFRASRSGQIVINNIVEGFSGVGGVGIGIPAGDRLLICGYNAFYNNTTNFNNAGDTIIIDLTAFDINPLAASAFIDAAGGDFRVKPSVQALGYPTADYPNLAVRSYLDIGALQRMSQMLTHPGMSGGTRA